MRTSAGIPASRRTVRTSSAISASGSLAREALSTMSSPAVPVLLGVQDREDEVLQLGLERLDAEPFGERDQYVPGDLGDARLFLGA